LKGQMIIEGLDDSWKVRW